MARTPHIKINPAVLTWAREWLNMEIGDVAKKLNTKPEIIRAWEKGEKQPTLIQLKTLSVKLEKPLEVFLYPVVPTLSEPEALYRAVYRAYSKKIPTEILLQISHTKQFQEKLRELTKGQNPAEHLITEETFSGDVATAAAQVRNFMKADLSSQKDIRSHPKAFDYWREILANVGVFVIKSSFKDTTYSGFCIADDPQYPVICVNNSMKHQRQIFTLFHELYHLLKKQNGVDLTDDKNIISSFTPEAQALERNCNRFAAEFLVPTDDFKAELIKLKITPPIKSDDAVRNIVNTLSNAYSVSEGMILLKLKETGDISQERYDKLQQEMPNSPRPKAGKGGGDYYATQVAYLGRSYIQLVLAMQDRDGFADYRAAYFLNVKTDQLHKLVAKVT